MTFHIVVATDITDESLAWLKEQPDVTVQQVPPALPAVREAIKTAHAIIAREDLQLDSALLEQATELKLIARPATSISGVDVDFATKRGIIVMNAPGISALAAGEHTIMMMLALSRRLIQAHNGMRSGYWLLDRKRQIGTQLAGKTLGIIGLGRVGKIVAHRALAFGMTVLACDPYLSEEQVGDDRIILCGMRDLLSRSDFVTLHVPLTSETHGMLNAERIRQMKPGARLINTADGKLLDEQAVVDALKDGHLAGVAVDVYAEEPPYNSPLVGLDNVIHTPHISDNTIEATQDLSIQIVQQMLDALRDVDYRNVVNLPFLPGMDFETIQPYLKLAERMGTLLHVLARHPVKRLAVEYRGEEGSGLVKPIAVAILKGLLMPILGDSVSYINAPVLAVERGIQVSQVKGLAVSEYTNLVSCQVTLEDGEDIFIAGTLLDRKVPHIIQINEYRMNFVPEGYLLLMGSYDKPGVIGRVGTLMANGDVNIASWHTGRAHPGGNTLTVLTLDSFIPEPVLEELRNLEFIRHAHQVQLS
ncbi:MAG: phosphoglycerate dehydrogenase [Phototrophicales bacterium]|nr:MAG: phosphoglycerate dehydrogenase [Phototrophicales bacterium]RMG77413.1 MAG: phosphoglycerate dehydrogenase [Chloroflexota bacterium]